MLEVLFLTVLAVDLPPGQVIDRVECNATPGQSYALYLPSNYTSDQSWPVVFAFDPGARGRVPVERFQAAAEKYGYVVAGSNNSRNGPWQGSMEAVKAMINDVGNRFTIDNKRLYLAGMSGGARLASGVALGYPLAAGVIASSASFPDGKPRDSVPFFFFGTAGTDDFNYREMRLVDRALKSPHHLTIFEGGHGWLSPDIAVEAIEWMEVQAMKAGRESRDNDRLHAIFEKRTKAAAAMPDDAHTLEALEAIARDFEGIENTSVVAARAAALSKDKRVRDGQKKERREEQDEEQQIRELFRSESALGIADRRQEALSDLRSRWKRLASAATEGNDSSERRVARRVLHGTLMAVLGRTEDPEYRQILEQYRTLIQRQR